MNTDESQHTGPDHTQPPPLPADHTPDSMDTTVTPPPAAEDVAPEPVEFIPVVPQDDSVIDEVLKHNATFAQTFDKGHLTAPPQRNLIVISCMDARINVQDALGLNYGDAHLLRNAGGVVTEDVLRSVIVSTNLMDTTEIMVIAHTGCGMMAATDDQLNDKMLWQYGPTGDCPVAFHTFTDLTAHVQKQVRTLKKHPWVPEKTVLRGFAYDIQTGKLSEISCRK